jgi:hypothetical protein
MVEPSRKEDEPRALAMAALSLVKALLNGLESKGLLDGGEVQAVLDETLTSLEHRVQDPATDLARRIVEATAITRKSISPD